MTLDAFTFVERVMGFQPPPQAGLTRVVVLGILAFSLVLLPMGNAPARAEAGQPAAVEELKPQHPSGTAGSDPQQANQKRQTTISLETRDLTAKMEVAKSAADAAEADYMEAHLNYERLRVADIT